MVNLEQLRKQAKELVRAARAGDAEALARLEGREPILARAQLVVAREHGYASWPALVTAVEANAESFVLAATNRQRTRAESLLAARPEIADDPWAKLVLGRGWDGDPNEPGGPRGWAPLLYVCHSCFASATLARELLARGADPNVTFVNEYGAMSALYGAAGVAHDPELTRVLLEAGAESGRRRVASTTRRRPRAPSASGSCSSTARRRRHERAGACARRGVGSSTSGCCSRRAPTRTRAHSSPMPCAAVAAPSSCACSPSTARTSTVPAARPGAATCRSGRPTSMRVLRGRDEHGAGARRARRVDRARTQVTRAVAALARGERPSTARSRAARPRPQEVIVLAALRGASRRRRRAVGPDFRGVVGGSPEGTLLHHAAWVGLAGAGPRRCSSAAPTPSGGRSRRRDATRLGRARLAVPRTRGAGLRRRSPSCSPPPGTRSKRASSTSPTARSSSGWRSGSRR